MNKLATAFKFGTTALLLSAIVQCSSVTTGPKEGSSKGATQGPAEGQIHRVKDVAQGSSKGPAEGQIHNVKDVSQDATQGSSKGPDFLIILRSTF
jgi:hypothetical protein